MTFRVNANSVKNAMGTVFLLAAAFFVCSTFISMRSVFADPIAPSNTLPQRSGRQSPRAATNTTKRATVSRATTSVRTLGATNARPASRTSVSRGGAANRTVSSRGIAPTRSTNVASRGVVSRSNTANQTANRAVRARAGTTQSRVSATGSVMSAGSRASTTTYSYLASKLYTGSYSNIIDSTTGLISADAYSNCLESYYTCMDEICTARSDTKGRCSCAGRATNFLVAEEQLEKANEELITLSGQLSLLIATKGKGDDLAAAFSLTDAEKVMNCVSYKEAKDKEDWCDHHPTFTEAGAVAACGMPTYCNESNNSFGFDIKNIDGASSDILAQLKAWADARDLAKEYSVVDNDNILKQYKTVSGVVNALTGITNDSENETANLDSLANKWGYDLFQYAHNNVCGRVLDSCFNGIYEACGTPKSITEDGKTVRIKCANGATSNCPFNYNSYISVESVKDGNSKTYTGEVILSDRSNVAATVSSSASCFGYTTTTSTSTTTRSVSSSSSDPYATLRGPVADARRSIMQKYLLDANASCDAYGSALKQTAQNINYQKIAAEQALQQKRLEFKQEMETQTLADATAAIDNFNECISEIWDCYEEYQDEENWTTARIKAYCSQVAQVPHCYETMICSPLQTQLTAVIDMPDSKSCKFSNDYNVTTCRNVVTISEILYGTGETPYDLGTNWNGVGDLNNVKSAGIREACLQRALGCGQYAGNVGSSETPYCLRRWNKTDKGQVATTVTSIADSEYASYEKCNPSADHATAGIMIDGACIISKCDTATGMEPNYYGTACVCPTGKVFDSNESKCVDAKLTCTNDEIQQTGVAKAEKTWDVSEQAYGPCVATRCDNGYTLTDGECVQESTGE